MKTPEQQKEYQREWNRKNKDKVAKSKKKYRGTAKHKLWKKAYLKKYRTTSAGRESKRRYYDRHKKQILAKSRERYLAKKEQIKKKNAAYVARMDKDLMRAKWRKYRRVQIRKNTELQSSLLALLLSNVGNG